MGLYDHAAAHDKPTAVTSISAVETRPWHVFIQACDHYASEGGPGSGRLAALSQCNRYSVRQRFRCGSESPFTSPWCGSSACPRCMKRWAKRAVRFARRQWPGKLWAASLPDGRGGGFAPMSRDRVRALRTAWQNLAAAMTRTGTASALETRPRAIISPDGLLLLARGTAASADEERRQAEAVAVRATLGGLWRLEARVVDRERAIDLYRQAIMVETRRFQEAVSDSLGGQPGAPHLEALIAHVRAAGRPPEAPGGRGAIPAGASPAASPLPDRRHCRSHGQGCPGEELVIRDLARGGAITSQEDSDALSAKSGRQAIHTLLSRVAARARPRRTISAVLRMAG